MRSPARRRGPRPVAPSPSPSPEAPVASGDVRLYADTYRHRGRRAAAAASLPIYPRWARPGADPERGMQ
jgi:hypothetical protein